MPNTNKCDYLAESVGRWLAGLALSGCMAAGTIGGDEHQLTGGDPPGHADQDAVAPADEDPPGDPGPDPVAAVTSAQTYFFGHSLVGHNMPQMVGTLARSRGKSYAVHGQIGFGTTVMAHWWWQGSFTSGFVPNGFREEMQNGALLFDVGGHTAIASGDYDVVVLTESNGQVNGSAGQWRDGCDTGNEYGGCTIDNTTEWVRLARQSNPNVRVFLYTNWKAIDDEGGMASWITRTRANAGWWEWVADEVEARLASVPGSPIRVIPAALVLADVAAAAERGELATHGVTNAQSLFSDNVHLTDRAFYLIALLHYAAIYRDTPVGLPARVDLVDGSRRILQPNALQVPAGLATYFQNKAWEHLSAYPRTGIID